MLYIYFISNNSFRLGLQFTLLLYNVKLNCHTNYWHISQHTYIVILTYMVQTFSPLAQPPRGTQWWEKPFQSANTSDSQVLFTCCHTNCLKVESRVSIANVLLPVTGGSGEVIAISCPADPTCRTSKRSPLYASPLLYSSQRATAMIRYASITNNQHKVVQ